MAFTYKWVFGRKLEPGGEIGINQFCEASISIATHGNWSENRTFAV